MEEQSIRMPTNGTAARTPLATERPVAGHPVDTLPFERRRCSRPSQAT